MIAAYIVAIYIGQIGYCVLLVLARDVETKVRPTLIYRVYVLVTSSCHSVHLYKA